MNYDSFITNLSQQNFINISFFKLLKIYNLYKNILKNMLKKI